jgi:hypothetical protein
VSGPRHVSIPRVFNRSERPWRTGLFNIAQTRVVDAWFCEKSSFRAEEKLEDAAAKAKDSVGTDGATPRRNR